MPIDDKPKKRQSMIHRLRSASTQAVARAKKFSDVVHTTRRSFHARLRTDINYEQQLHANIDLILIAQLETLMRDLKQQQNDVMIYNPWIQTIIEYNSVKNISNEASSLKAEFEVKPDNESFILFILKYCATADDSTKKLLENYLQKLHDDVENEIRINPGALDNLAKVDGIIANIMDLIEYSVQQSTPELKKIWNVTKNLILNAKDNFNYGEILDILKSKDIAKLKTALSTSQEPFAEKLQELSDRLKIELIIQPIARLAVRGHFDIYLIPIAALLMNIKADPKLDLAKVASGLKKPAI